MLRGGVGHPNIFCLEASRWGQGSRVTCSSLQRGHGGSTEICLRREERYVTSSQESVRLLAALKSFDQEYLPYILLTSGVSVDGKGTTLLRRK